jgi:D-tyrosyl-tRNA(Tyr) deacylase
MRIVVQRVLRAGVTVGETTVGAIGHGICALVGIAHDDTEKDVEYAVRKLLQLRIFPNPENKKGWDKNVMDVSGGVLLVSQFTLCHVLKGNKPDFHNAMSGPEAKILFDKLVESVRKAHPDPSKIQTGAFGEYMNVSIVNDGPVTIQLNSRGEDP